LKKKFSGFRSGDDAQSILSPFSFKDEAAVYPSPADFWSIDQLEKQGRSMARLHELDWRPRRDRLLARLAENEKNLADVYRLLSAAEYTKQIVTPTGIWLLDNFYLIEEQIRIARRHLPRSYSRELPRLRSGPEAGFPRIYAVVNELIRHADGRVDEGNLSTLLSAYQKGTTLTLGELWAVPVMVRLSLIENLLYAAVRVTANRSECRLADEWADRLLAEAARGPNDLILDMADMVKADLPLGCAFTAQLVKRLQNQNPALNLPLTWIEQRLSERGETIERQIELDSRHQATNQISISNSIGSLRLLQAIDWRHFIESLSRVEAALRGDPAGIYAKMDFATRDAYRHAVENIAARSRAPEERVAGAAIRLAAAMEGRDEADRHVGRFLVGRERRLLEKAVRMRRTVKERLAALGARSPLLFYVGSISLIAVLLSALALWSVRPGGWGTAAWLALLLLLGSSRLALSLVNWAASVFTTPRRLPRMNFRDGIPREFCTLVTVPAMLSSYRETKELVDKIEVCFLANREANLYFSLLTDFRDAPRERMDDDERLLRLAEEGVRKLNEKYGGAGARPFLLFHRPRSWNPREKLWMGYERKRGKLEALNNALRSPEPPSLLIEGDPAVLPRIKYVLTLDADTQLPRETARLLVETMAHPLNAPRYDEAKQRVVSGYAILQPGVVSSLSAARRSAYAAIFGSESGIDPYTRAVSDVYQDLFGEGSFTGKGIYDVDVFARALAGRMPENRILSHDLLEGAYARSGLASDVRLVEDFPAGYSEDISRRHRWIRGDWQIAAWLLPRVRGAGGTVRKNPISALSRWKILDNLRRSLVPCGLTLLAVLSWIFLTPPWLGLAAVAGILLLPLLPETLEKALRKPVKYPLRLHLLSLGLFFLRRLFQALFAFATLPYEALLNLDAIFRTLWRMLVSRRRLLEWTTSREARQRAGRTLGSYYRMMLAAPLGVLAGLLGLVLLGPAVRIEIWIVLGMWFFSPVLAWWVSRPLRDRSTRLTARESAYLRKISRKTWRFFETFVTADHHWLPPDNYQEEPEPRAALMTSPTNIGLSLLSNLGAYDLGYLSAGQLLNRTAHSLGVLKKLERYRGHFFNWYDTQTRKPLSPRYVSTVDSGNLAGHLLTLRSGLLELRSHPVFPPQTWSGLVDALAVLADELTRPAEGEPAVPKKSALAALLDELEKSITGREKRRAGPGETLQDLDEFLRRLRKLRELAGETISAEAIWWFQAIEEQCLSAQEDLIFIAPWLAGREDGGVLWPEIDAIHTLDEVAGLYARLDEAHPAAGGAESVPEGAARPSADAASSLLNLVREGSSRARARIDQASDSARQCAELADQEYDFLYDRKRRLLAVGYNEEKHRLDESFYDLLASEARLASFIGVARGRLPVEHWFALGRPVFLWKGNSILLSWGGSMFEYLMPLLVMPDYRTTLVGRTCRAVVEKQIAYCRKRGVPWGISESAENVTDADGKYQYRSFGVPDLGLRRGLADDLVVAPYATLLALLVAPEKACANLQDLSARGFEGRFGLYEAIDYSTDRPAREKPRGHALIRSFMAHHQGIGFLSLVNFFTGHGMARRFAADPLIKAALLLLQERVPKAAPFQAQPAAIERTRPRPERQAAEFRVFDTPHTGFPEVHLLSNGRYHVMVTNSGGGYSRWRDLSVTRWSEDPTRDRDGVFVYVDDLTGKHSWSAAFQPMRTEPKSYEVIFSPARAEFRRRDHGLETYTEIAVSPENDVEHRRVTVTNLTLRTRTVELTSYAEPALEPPAAEALHPAFSKLFMRTEIAGNLNAVLCSRRPRSPRETPPWLVHLLVVPEGQECAVSFETDRLRFLGRDRDAGAPLALAKPGPLSGAAGAVLDPIVSIRCRVALKPGESVTAGFILGMTETRDEAFALIEKYRDWRLADRVFAMARIHGKVVLNQLGATEEDAQLYGRLASAILYAGLHNRADPALLLKNKKGPSGLWAYGVSGDLPIVLLRIGSRERIDLAAKLIQAHAYWRLKGLPVDLVIWNEDWTGYRQELQDKLVSLITAGSEGTLFDKAGGIYIRHPDQMTEEDRILFQAAARVIVTEGEGTLEDQLRQDVAPAIAVPALKGAPPERTSGTEENFRQDDLLFWNGWGGFTHDGREYIIQIRPGEPTPRPWVNVLANRRLGTVVSAGGGYTWAENAHEFRLTPWHNDPVTDASGEVVYLRDEDSGLFWSALPLPAPGSADYLLRHGFGYSVFEYSFSGLKSELWIYVDVESPVKFWLLKVRNDSPGPRRLSATVFTEPVLGDTRPKNQMHVRTEIDLQTGVLFVTNPYNIEFPNRVMFLAVNSAQRYASGDRTAFIGRNGSLSDPAALHRERLTGRTGGGLDPAAALMAPFALDPGQETEIVFILGAGKDAAEARALVERHGGALAAYQARDRVWEYWKHTLGAVYVESPDAALNMIANGWLVYQTVTARLWGRSGFYQSGGAFGFRDQLQDVMALLHAEPELIRAHLLLAASRQFREGDVQHWWHPPLGRGVRTRISDDYLWLPFVAAFYVSHTGDTGALDESAPFIEGRSLNPGEDSYYDLPVLSQESASLYEHCVRAIERGLQFGAHGLPLMGGGDWNDGMNLVGAAGRGESVWLAFFLYDVLSRFAPLARRRGDEERAVRFEREAERLRENIDTHAWDGAWYRRAFFDDGTALGSSANAECRIDAVAQSWSVLSGAGAADKAERALESLEERLVRPESGLILLLDPPFDKSDLEPGYIKGYVPGIRENGGQYTHAAVWAVMAFAERGEREKVRRLLGMINPVNHGSSPEKIGVYQVEPYVMAADIYGAAPHTGRGGWTWYTGSAGWMYRLIVESVFGLDRRPDKLIIKPCLPPDWERCTLHYRYRETVYHLLYTQLPEGRDVRVTVDGEPQPDGSVTLADDRREHFAEIVIGAGP
jgi:cyclic beta-1,2-glucan synthetase